MNDHSHPDLPPDPQRVSSDPGPAQGPLSELLRLQTDFHARITDELLRYLRGLQGAMAPAIPGTVVRTGEAAAVVAAAPAGGTAELRLQLENLQRVHCLATVALTPLVAADGTTWYPETSPPIISKLIGPDEAALLSVPISIPGDLPAGAYRGLLHLQGFRGRGVAVVVTVGVATP